MSSPRWTADGEGIRRLVRDETGRIVCCRHRMSAAENEMFMNLIAQAPAMYDELKSILDWALHETKPLRRQEINHIRMVLAKARGEA